MKMLSVYIVFESMSTIACLVWSNKLLASSQTFSFCPSQQVLKAFFIKLVFTPDQFVVNLFIVYSALSNPHTELDMLCSLKLSKLSSETICSATWKLKFRDEL